MALTKVDKSLLETTSGTADATTFLRGDGTWDAPASATLAPAFSACANADVAITSDVSTKVTLNREVFDSNSAYDPTTNYRFTVPAGEGGKYLITAGATFASTSDIEIIELYIFKNGAAIAWNIWTCGTTYIEVGYDTRTLACGLDLSAADYLELFAYQVSAGGTQLIKGSATLQASWMSGFKLVGI